MAIANFTLERLKTALKNDYLFTISYNDKKYDIGRRYMSFGNYYCFDRDTLDLKIYYTVNDLLNYALIDGKPLKLMWDYVSINEEFLGFKLNREIEIIKKFKKRMGE